MAAFDAEYDLTNLRLENGYNKAKAYRFSKLSNLLFSIELNNRLKGNNIQSSSIAAHPGYARTNLQRYVAGPLHKAHSIYTKYRYAKPVSVGILPILHAAVGIKMEEANFIGPGMSKKQISLVDLPKLVNEENRKMLWHISEQFTGVKFNFKSL